MEVDPVKLICLNDPVNVGTDAPDVRLMFNLFDAVAPAVPPKLNVLVTDIAADILDVPVNVKPVAVAIDRAVPTKVTLITPVLPNATERTLLLFDEKTPVVMLKLFRSSVPEVNVTVFVDPNKSVVKASCSVAVAVDSLIVNEPIAFPFDVNVPVPTIVKSAAVKVPPEESVNP